MTNYSDKAKPTTNARTIRLRNAHQGMCSFHDMCQSAGFKPARQSADVAIKAIERAAYHAGIRLDEIDGRAHGS